MAKRQGPRAQLRRRFFGRLSGLLAALTAAICAALSLFAIHDQRREELAYAESVTVLLAPQAQRLMLWDERVALSALLKELVAAHGSVSYAYVEREGKPYVHTFDRGTPRALLASLERPWPSPSHREIRTTDGRSYVDVGVALSALPASVHVGVAQSRLHRAAASRIAIIIGVGLVLMMGGIGFSWHASGVMTRQLALTETALRESEARYRVLFDQAPGGILLLDAATLSVLDANRTALAIHGKSSGRLVGAALSDVEAPGAANGLRSRVAEILSGSTISYEAEHRRTDGGSFPAEVIARKVELGGRPAIQVIERDISQRRHAEAERKKLQDHIVEAQKLEAVGQLAGGVAHGINNVLGAIAGAASLLEGGRSAAAPELQACARAIVESCQNGRELTGSLLGLAGRGKFGCERFSLQDCVAQAGQHLRVTAPDGVGIEIQVPQAPLFVKGDRALLTQAILNLGLNAIDAMPGGGTVVIALEEDEVPAGTLVPVGRGLVPGRSGTERRARIRVRDTGIGMDAETLAHALEPFFTTKPLGKGTGLGLPMVHGVAQRHDGSLELESRPGAGTTVTILLPVTEAPESPVGASPVAEHRGGVILLVDDDDLIRWSYGTYLTKRGYVVMEARDGREAVAIYLRERDRIELVILDLLMPVMDGHEAFRELRTISPDLKVLISSGYSRDERVAELMAQGAVAFVPKPTELSRLVDLVARLLASPR